ncbi:hypothetical protein MSPP1_003709 [Malassezia sp. CBS 17886]|nr:hypothetical protein MSPP1_003709 [Malassezia sp. CBS 17886]
MARDATPPARTVQGRVLVCGSVVEDDGGAGVPVDLAQPHILRAMSNVLVDEMVSSPLARHAFFFARGDVRHDFFPPLCDRDTVVAAAAGATHSLLITSTGALYAAGSNAHGQCGIGAAGAAGPGFRWVDGLACGSSGDKAVGVAAGRTFSLVRTQGGDVYAMGSTAHGQLGTGAVGWKAISPTSGAYAAQTRPVRVRGLANIAQIACGEAHAVALDRDGGVFTWGCGHYGRLGCGAQSEERVPVRVPQFVRKPHPERARAVYAGRTCTVVLDAAARLWVAGAPRVTGDGGWGQGFFIFKPLPAFADVDVTAAALGADAALCLAAPSPGDARVDVGMRAFAWGERATHGELALRGALAATEPSPCTALAGLSVLGVASMQHTSLWLVRNAGDAYSALPRFPVNVASSDTCLGCARSGDEDGATLLECDRCENAYHLACLVPPLGVVPRGEWFCDLYREGEQAGES